MIEHPTEAEYQELERKVAYEMNMPTDEIAMLSQYAKEIQQNSPDKNSGNPWTVGEIKKLKELRKTKTVEEIAQILYRTPGAIRRAITLFIHKAKT